MNTWKGKDVRIYTIFFFHIVYIMILTEQNPLNVNFSLSLEQPCVQSNTYWFSMENLQTREMVDISLLQGIKSNILSILQSYVTPILKI